MRALFGMLKTLQRWQSQLTFAFVKSGGHACGLRIEKKELRKKKQAKERSGRTGLE
jgi:hypothetical protein